MLIDVNEAALYYEERGDGGPLLLIHGGLASSSQWEPVVPQLTGRFRVITQVTLELGSRHPETAPALIVGAAYPDFDTGGLREAHRALLGAGETGVPDPAHLDAELGEFAEEIKALHPGGDEQWRALLRQTAPMWLDYDGLRPDELRAIRTPVLVLAGDRDELVPLDLAVSLYRTLPNAELAVCPSLSHDGPTPERAAVIASLIRDFALRHSQT